MDTLRKRRPTWLRAIINNTKFYLIYDAKRQTVTVQRIPGAGTVIGYVYAENINQAYQRINEATIERYRYKMGIG